MRKYVNIDNTSAIYLDNIQIVDGKLVKYYFHSTDNLSKYFLSYCLFVSYSENIENIPPSILTIPFVATTMALSWLTGSTIFVDSIDSRFYESYKKLREAFQYMYPTLNLGGKLYAAHRKENIEHESQIDGCMFSGGLDAITTFIQHKDSVKYLIYTNGLIHNVNESNDVYNAETTVISSFAELYNVTSIFIKSNFFYFINQDLITKKYKKHISNFWHDLYHSSAFLGCAAPIAFKYNLKDIFIGSSNIATRWNACASDPTTDNEFCYSKTKAIHDGFELDRQDKIRIIVEEQRKMNKKYPLHVCSFNDHNCCSCEKCFRTIWGIVAGGADPHDFNFNYDLPLKEHVLSVLDAKGALLGFDLENRLYWPAIKEDMQNNYVCMSEENKEFVDWFMAFDYKSRKESDVRRYYRQNFFSILKRKLHL